MSDADRPSTPSFYTPSFPSLTHSSPLISLYSFLQTPLSPSPSHLPHCMLRMNVRTRATLRVWSNRSCAPKTALNLQRKRAEHLQLISGLCCARSATVRACAWTIISVFANISLYMSCFCTNPQWSYMLYILSIIHKENNCQKAFEFFLLKSLQIY